MAIFLSLAPRLRSMATVGCAIHGTQVVALMVSIEVVSLLIVIVILVAVVVPVVLVGLVVVTQASWWCLWIW